jgi:hypothetical protein
VIEQMNAEPVPVTITHSITGEKVELSLTGADFANAAFRVLYHPNGASILPVSIDQLKRGDTTVLQLWAQDLLPRGGGSAMLLYMAVECYEEVPFDSA